MHICESLRIDNLKCLSDLFVYTYRFLNALHGVDVDLSRDSKIRDCI